MSVGFDKHAIKNRDRPHSVMPQIETCICILEMKSEENCLAHALAIAIAKLHKDPNYKAYRQGRKIRHVVETLLEKAGIDLSNGAGIPELVRFQEHFQGYKIFVYHSLNCDNIVFERQVDSAKRLNIL